MSRAERTAIVARIPTWRSGLPRRSLVSASGLTQGAYILAEAGEFPPEVILIATGSEVSLALDAQQRLDKEGIRSRVISMPCWELFDAQPRQYRDAVLPPNVRARVSIEAASPFGWERDVGPDGAIIGVNRFGASRRGQFVGVKLYIDTWRWAGVPIYIRAGKELRVTATELVVEFRRPPRETFGEIVPSLSSHVRMRISPDINIGMGLRVKAPGECMVGNDVELILTRQAAADMPPHRRLLGDAMHGIGELFAREDFVEAEWGVVDPFLGNVMPLYPYEPSSWGPEEAAQLSGSDGPWLNPEHEHLNPDTGLK